MPGRDESQIDDAVTGALLRLWEGIRVDEEALAFDAISQVIERGGDFLSHAHTIRHFRDELSSSPLMARTQREEWQASGSTSLAERAAARVRQLLDRPRSPCLNDQQLRDLRAIEQRSLQRYK